MAITPIDPHTLDELEHEYDAREIAGLSNTDPVATWEDSAGSVNATAAGARRPEYRTNVQNGLPGVYFGGTQSMASAVSSVTNRAARTIIVVGQIDSGADGSNQTAVGLAGASAQQMIFAASRSTNQGQAFWNGSWRVTSGVLNKGRTFVWAWDYSQAANQTFLHHDLVDSDTPGANGTTPAHERIVLGGSIPETTPSNELDGYLFHVLVFDSVLPRSVREGVEAWLADIWEPPALDRYTYGASGEVVRGSRDFGDDTLSAQPAGTTAQWNSTTWEVVEAAGAGNGRAVEGTGTGSRSGLSFDAPGLASDAETLARMSGSSGNASHMGAVVRGSSTLSGSSPNAGTYIFNRTSSGAGRIVQEWDSGSAPLNENYGGVVSAGTWYWARTRAEGDVGRYKLWTGALGDEPEEWLAVLPLSVDDAGWLGVTVLSAAGTQLLDEIHWATNGGTAAPVLLEVTTERLPPAESGVAYSHTLEGTGGAEPYTWSIIGGVLPTGLSLNASTGEISGTTTVEGSVGIVAQLEDDNEETANRFYVLQVLPEGGGSPDVSRVDPHTLVSLVHEYDARDLSALSNEDPVTTWEDGAGSADATEAGAARPTFRTNVLNGLPGVHFNGSQRLSTAAASVANEGARTVIAIGVVDTASGSGSHTVVGLSGETTQQIICAANRLGNRGQGFWNGEWRATAEAVDKGRIRVWAWDYDGAGNRVALHRDMVDPVGPKANGTSPTHERLVLGASQPAGGSDMEGTIFHVLVFDAVLPRSVREGVEAWLSDIWDPPAAYRYDYAPSGTQDTGEFDFEADTLGALPSGLTGKWATDEEEWEVVEEAGALNGRALRANPDVFQQHGMALDALDDLFDVELLIRGRIANIASQSRPALALRGADTQSGDPARADRGWTMSDGQDGLRAVHWEDGERNHFDFPPPVAGTGFGNFEWHNIRARMRGDVLRLSSWNSHSPPGSPPTEWEGALDVASAVQAGWFGVYTGADDRNTYWDSIAWATNGLSTMEEPEEPEPEDPLPGMTTLEAESPGTVAFLLTSVFQPGSAEQQHVATDWRIRVKGESEWTLADLRSTVDLVNTEVSGMPEFATLEAQARHVGEDGDGVWEGPWSAVVEFETSEETPLPFAPQLTVEDVGLDSVTISRSEFDHPEGTQEPPGGEDGGEAEDEEDTLPWHVASRYQVRRQSNQEVVLNTGMQPTLTALSQFFDELAEPGAALEIRAQDQDGKYGAPSPWGEWVPFALMTLDALRPDTPTITVDVCGGGFIDVSGSVYSTPDEANPEHVESRWWIGTGAPGSITWRSVVTDDPADLLSFRWPNPPPGYFYLALSYRDEEDRWSERSEPATCEIPIPPPQPFITDPVCSGITSADLLIEWDVIGDAESYEWSGGLSINNGESYAALFTRQEGASHLFEIEGLPDGDYIFRVQACDPDDGPCGDYAYLPITVDRTGEASLTVPYNFSELAEFPETWDVAWNPTGEISFSLVNRDLEPEPPFVGILANNGFKYRDRQGILRFNELGQPTDIDATIVMAWVPRDTTGWGARFAYTNYLFGGFGWRALDAGEFLSVEAGVAEHRQGIAQMAHPGGPSFPFPVGCCSVDGCECPCRFISGAICNGGAAATAVMQRIVPDRLHRYGIASNRAGWLRWMQTHNASVPRKQRAPVPWPGVLRRGAVLSTQEPDQECDPNSACRYLFRWYVQRIRIRRVSSTHVRVQSQLLGPGVVSSGWQYDELERYRGRGTLGNINIECGPCGLAYSHLQNLTMDHGVLFRCARFTIYDDEVSGGPALGQATIVGEGS